MADQEKKAQDGKIKLQVFEVPEDVPLTPDWEEQQGYDKGRYFMLAYGYCSRFIQARYEEYLRILRKRSQEQVLRDLGEPDIMKYYPWLASWDEISGQERANLLEQCYDPVLPWRILHAALVERAQQIIPKIIRWIPQMNPDQVDQIMPKGTTAEDRQYATHEKEAVRKAYFEGLNFVQLQLFCDGYESMRASLPDAKRARNDTTEVPASELSRMLKTAADTQKEYAVNNHFPKGKKLHTFSTFHLYMPQGQQIEISYFDVSVLLAYVSLEKDFQEIGLKDLCEKLIGNNAQRSFRKDWEEAVFWSVMKWRNIDAWISTKRELKGIRERFPGGEDDGSGSPQQRLRKMIPADVVFRLTPNDGIAIYFELRDSSPLYLYSRATQQYWTYSDAMLAIMAPAIESKPDGKWVQARTGSQLLPLKFYVLMQLPRIINSRDKILHLEDFRNSKRQKMDGIYTVLNCENQTDKDPKKIPAKIRDAKRYARDATETILKSFQHTGVIGSWEKVMDGRQVIGYEVVPIRPTFPEN